MMLENPYFEWDDYLNSQPEAHLLQTSAWGQLKKSFGWEVQHVLGRQSGGCRFGAQILFRTLPLGWCIAYIPKGPPGLHSWELLDGNAWQGFLTEVDTTCRRFNTILVILEPDSWEGDEYHILPGFQLGLQSIQPPRTILVDLRGGEEEILARMRQKTRYNIRLAQKKGVRVYPSQDLDAFYRLMQTTAARDNFGVHTIAYYQAAHQIFYPRGECEILLAEYDGEPLAGLMVFAHGSRAWYFYGASSDAHRELMPAYLIQWEAMRWAMRRGCTQYDLWGVPDADEINLESNFTTRSDGLWGVYRFKRGFGGEIRRSAGPFQRVYHPFLYKIYRLALNRKSQIVL